MSIQPQHSTARLAGRWRKLGLATAILICAGLSGCTAVQPPTAAPTAESGDAETMPYESTLDPGTYVVDTFAVPFEVTVPEGWRILGGWRLIRETPDESHAAFLTFLNSAYVPADACNPSTPFPKVEPTIEGFVDALSAQASTTTTAAAEVMLGDYRALEFDLAVESGVDIDGCTSAHVCIHSDTTSCTRWYTSVTEQETYRIVDLSGARAVLSVGQYDDEVDAAVMDEALAVFDSITFAPSD